MEESSKAFEGVDIPKSKWPILLEEILKYSPEIRLEYAGTVMKSKLLARRTKEDRFSTTFVIELPTPDLSKEILGKRQVIRFFVLYLGDGEQHYVHSDASLERFIIYYGYPALVMTMIPPIKHYSQAAVSYPSEDKPVHISIPAEGKPAEIRATEVSANKIVTETVKQKGMSIQTGSVEGMTLKLPSNNNVSAAGNVIKTNDDRLMINLKDIDETDKETLNNYLYDDFKSTYDSRISYLMRIKKDKDSNINEISSKKISLILIIDDEVDSHLALTILLEKRGYRYEFAENGAEGIRKARIINPDLILLDINMPQLNGLETLKLLRMFLEVKEVPVIMLTGNTNLETVAKSSEYGISGYVSKPYDPIEVVQRIENILK